MSVGSCFGLRDRRESKARLNLDIGPLSAADENGVMLPAGFSSRIIASSGLAPHIGSSYRWHDAPDGGAIFQTDTGGWIYVSNSELGRNRGGAGAIRFDASGHIIKAYPLLVNTSQNCAGGATPWGTWLSCEESEYGIVWECDPYGQELARPRYALGRFSHEAATVDTRKQHIYLTEDKPDGCLYRFVPASLNNEGFVDLSNGRLEVAVIDWSVSRVTWVAIPDPVASTRPTRYQLDSSAKFNGGEGIVFYDGLISFATKGDNRIWSYDTGTNRIFVAYDAITHPNPILTGVDNITLAQDGSLLVGEDGGNLQIVVVTHSGQLLPLIQLIGHDLSEVTGPAFSPDGKRLYFSSQRGRTGFSNAGITFEVEGPFHH
jgi:secreted PhoX family phosphatase